MVVVVVVVVVIYYLYIQTADEITIQLKQIGEVIFDDKTEQIATTKK